jgi:phosphoribosylformylglycinamidine synthase
MPHPERFVDRTQHPNWRRRSEGEEPHGLAFVRGVLRGV